MPSSPTRRKRAAQRRPLDTVPPESVCSERRCKKRGTSPLPCVRVSLSPRGAPGPPSYQALLSPGYAFSCLVHTSIGPAHRAVCFPPFPYFPAPSSSRRWNGRMFLPAESDRMISCDLIQCLSKEHPSMQPHTYPAAPSQATSPSALEALATSDEMAPDQVLVIRPPILIGGRVARRDCLK